MDHPSGRRPEFTFGMLLNRRNRRRIEKALRCAQRRSKVPLGVLHALTAPAIDRIGLAHDVKILPTGRCIPRNDSALAAAIA